ncbi:hypothetical protein [Perlabentimonas gracilis]|uniref:hypothetical protein n=1 Tax=Perlabentimonas gracilis TaxID=2715279 RepID=UPI00140E2FF1|nr:hypothetical protein [Perlabentimonas gracilis]NHB69685.1 hypothetical protein [Perlabentimonas gracilis]
MKSSPQKAKVAYSVSVSCETISLPPFEDILVLSYRCPQGKIGVSKCINLLSPEDFEMIAIDHDTVEAIIVSKKILKKMPAKKVVETLNRTVFPMVSQGEIVKVDFKLTASWSNIEIDDD